jgi:glycosyltransferase involved in cell wall biosynthesis
VIVHSLVIPAHNEEVYLPRLLDTLPSDPSIEVIVADNASTDSTATLAAARGCRVVPVERRIIAAARNAGAAAATGEFLSFVDADSRLSAGTFDAVRWALSDPGVAGGATGVVFDRWSAGIGALYAFMLPLVWITGLDTGVVFCRRADFEALGGYDERRHFAEDLDFVLRLRSLGRRRGQRLVRLRGVKTVTSTRKFDARGDWHYFPLLIRLGWRFLLRPFSAPPLARRYWYGDR